MTDLVLERLLKTAWFQALSSVSTNTSECGKGAARWLPLGERLAKIFTVSFDSVLPACYHLLDGSACHAHADAYKYLAFSQLVGVGGQWWKRGTWMHIWLDCEMIPVGDSGVFQSQYIESEKEV